MIPRGAFISVGDYTPTEKDLLLLTTCKSGSLLDRDKCPVPESNQRHEDFQSSALPTELTGQLICLFYLIFLLLSRHCSSQIVRHSLILLQFTASFAQNTHTGLTISRTCTGNIAIYVASSDNVYSQNLPLINMIPATHVRMTVDQFSSLERA